MSGVEPLGPARRVDRSRARAWVLQIHYLWEASGGGETLRDALVHTTATRRVSPRRLPYVRRLIQLLDENLIEVDAHIRDALENWRLERLSTIDRAILRLGAAEILFVDDVPPKVSLQEAIQLAEAYGGPESPRFVNGVLDALYKRTAGATGA